MSIQTGLSPVCALVILSLLTGCFLQEVESLHPAPSVQGPSVAPGSDGIDPDPPAQSPPEDPPSETAAPVFRRASPAAFDADFSFDNGVDAPSLGEYDAYVRRAADYHQLSITGDQELWEYVPLEGYFGPYFLQYIVYPVTAGDVLFFWGMYPSSGVIFQWTPEERIPDPREMEPVEAPVVFDSPLGALNYVLEHVYDPNAFSVSYQLELAWEADTGYPYYRSQVVERQGKSSVQYFLDVSEQKEEYVVHGYTVAWQSDGYGTSGTNIWCYLRKNGFVSLNPSFADERRWIVIDAT